MFYVVLCFVAQSCLTVCNPPGSSVHGEGPGKNTGVGSHSLLQGIYLTQVSNPGFLHCRQIIYHLSRQGLPHKGNDLQLSKISVYPSLRKLSSMRKLSAKISREHVLPQALCFQKREFQSLIVTFKCFYPEVIHIASLQITQESEKVKLLVYLTRGG